jgi:hypothetical protein
MRVILVGPASARGRLRAQTNGSLAIVAELMPTIRTVPLTSWRQGV